MVRPENNKVASEHDKLCTQYSNLAVVLHVNNLQVQKTVTPLMCINYTFRKKNTHLGLYLIPLWSVLLPTHK